MSSKLRPFEVLLPVRFNDGREIPDQWLAEALNETVARFEQLELWMVSYPIEFD